jgi:hypothetical protein
MRRMGSFEHSGWRWEPLWAASEELAADFLTAGFLGEVSWTTDEMRRQVRSKDESGEHLSVLASRNGRAECFLRFSWNTKFVEMGILIRDEFEAELLAGLAAIGAYVRDRTGRVMCLDPTRPGSKEVRRLFPDAYETGYLHVTADDIEELIYAPGPPTIVLDGECSAPPLAPAAGHGVDEMLAEHEFAGFEL